jgi:tetratricopeptide (TPR) repeat protein
MVLVILVALAGCFEASAQTPVQQAQLAADRAQQAADAAKSEAEKAKAAAEKSDQALKKLDTVSTDLVGRATYVSTTASGLISYVQFTVAIGTALAGLAAVVTGWNLLKSRKKIKKKVAEATTAAKEATTAATDATTAATDATTAATDATAKATDATAAVTTATAAVTSATAAEKVATAAADRIVEARGRVEPFVKVFSDLGTQVTAVLDNIARAVGPTPPPEAALIGAPPSDVPQSSYDNDALVMFADRLGIIPPTSQTAELLVDFGKYWRQKKEYRLAIGRIQRALEIDPASARAHKNLGRAYWNKVGDDLPATGIATSAEHKSFLDRAEAELNAAKNLLTSRNEPYEDILFDFGTISRFRGNHSAAISNYEEGARLSKVRAQGENRAPDWDFDYAIACLYARDKNQYQQAVDKMKEIVNNTQTWDQDRSRTEPRNYREWMRTDQDFEGMMAEDDWKRQLDAL